MTTAEKIQANDRTIKEAVQILNRLFGEDRYFSSIEMTEEDRHDGKVTIVLSLTEIKGEEMNQQQFDELMKLIDKYGDDREAFGDYQTSSNGVAVKDSRDAVVKYINENIMTKGAVNG